jgi:hypothetical protein
MQRYVSDNLRFIEFERTALPCALMRTKNGLTSQYSFEGADADARVVMEQRIQSLVCSVSMVRKVLEHEESTDGNHPIQIVDAAKAVQTIFSYLSSLPILIEQYAILPLLLTVTGMTLSSNKKKSKSTKTKGNVSSTSSSILPENMTSHQLSEIELGDRNKSYTKALKIFLNLQNEFTTISDENVVNSSSQNYQSEFNQIDRLLKVAEDVKHIIEKQNQEYVSSDCNTKTRRLGWIRGIISSIREVLHNIEDINCSTARFNLLSDILVLWSNTSNFSTPKVSRDVQNLCFHLWLSSFVFRFFIRLNLKK